MIARLAGEKPMPLDAVPIIRSDLIHRIDGIAAAAGRISLATLCEQIDAIRRLAQRHRLDTVENLAGMLETATSYHGHGHIVLSYLDRMREAVDDMQASDSASAARVN
jgi:HPt (histidine-containing phosphotransfer) domain-containing protein